MPHPPPKSRLVHLVSLGCPKNRVDSERMLGNLHLDGFSLVDDPEDADLLVVNTCAFIEPAKEESIEAILAMAEIKARRKGKKLVVAGCLAQRYGKELADELPEVDHFLGTDSLMEIRRITGESVGSAGSFALRVLTERAPGNVRLRSPRVRSTRGGSAYLKIAEGCDHACSFCVIPSIRGPLSSIQIDPLVEEARELVEGGVRELNLIAQDLFSFGRDLPGRPQLVDLLDRLIEIEGLAWIRMLYAYPGRLSERMLETWAASEKILPYLDIPLQHASGPLLQRMKRPSNVDEIRKELCRIKSRFGDRGFTLRTTFLVGHPGETDEDFDALLRFVEEMRFDRMGVFVYSDEEGSSAFEMEDKVDPVLAEERRARLMELQQGISADHQSLLVGRRLSVLVEGASEESELVLQGRHGGQAPEIDGLVYIEDGIASPGEIVEVEIHTAHDYDLVGSLV